MKTMLLRCLRMLVRVFGCRIRDFETGEVLGKALLVPWRGRIEVICYQSKGRPRPLVPRFAPQDRLTYWRQSVVFTRHGAVDFDRVRDSGDEFS